jgi:hypothetical protein
MLRYSSTIFRSALPSSLFAPPHADRESDGVSRQLVSRVETSHTLSSLRRKTSRSHEVGSFGKPFSGKQFLMHVTVALTAWSLYYE